MLSISVKDLYTQTMNYEGKLISLSGWVKTIRGSKSFSFVELNDGTFMKNVQIVLDNTLVNFDEVVKLPLSSSIRVEGTVVLTPNANQNFEIHAKEIKIEGTSELDYPLQKKRHSFEYLRTIAHLRPRTNTFFAVFKVRSLVSFAIHQFLQEQGFIYVHTPLITSSDSEGAGEMFRVTTLDLENLPKNEDGSVNVSEDFFKKETNLTVSGQLPAEAFALAYRNVYTFGPTFRAENSHTTRHASEFWMVEPEMAFADLKDIIQVAEALIKYVIDYVLKKAPEEMEFFNKFIDKELMERLTLALTSEFASITYTKAIEILKEATVKFEHPVDWGTDLQTEHERYICEEVFKKPVFITDYPKEIKAFYMRNNDDGKTVAATDLLVPGIGELIGGSQREERVDQLEKKMEEFHLSKEEYQWYLDLRRYGGTKHSGFGIGLERLLMYITGMSNIRDVIPYPRTPGRADF